MKNKRIILMLPLVLFLAGCDSIVPVSSSDNSILSSSIDSEGTSIGNSTNDSLVSSEETSTSSESSIDELAIRNEIVHRLKGEYSFDGSYVIQDDEGTFVHKVKGFFKENEYFNKDSWDEDMQYDYYVLREGKVYFGELNNQNEFDYTLVEELTDFDSLTNPLASLDVDDLILEDGYYVLDGTFFDLALITGWNYNSAKAYISLDKDELSMRIETVEAYGENEYNFIIYDKDYVSANYKANFDTEVLVNAFEEIGTDNFTVTEVNHMDGEEDITAKIYVTEDIVYNSYKDVLSTPFGYVAKGDKTYYFTNKDGVFTYENTNYSLDGFRFSATLINPNFFVYDEEKDVYKFADAFLTEEFACYFGYYFDSISAFCYAYDFELKLTKEGSIDYVAVYTSIYSYNIDYVIRFSDIGTTEVPFTVDDIVGEVETEENDISNLYGEYVGTIVHGSDSFGGVENVSILINENGFYIDSDKYDIVNYNEEVLTVKKDDNQYDFAFDSYYNCYVFYNNDVYMTVKSVNSSDNTLSAYYGTYEGDVNRNEGVFDCDKVTFVISENGITFNGEVCTFVEKNNYGDVVFKVGNVTLSAMFSSDNTYVELFNDALTFTTDKLYKKVESSEEEFNLSDYFGTYIGEPENGTEIIGSQVVVTISEGQIAINNDVYTFVAINDGELSFEKDGKTVFFGYIEYYQCFYISAGDYSFFSYIEKTN